MIRVKGPQDLGAGILFMIIGAGGLYFGKDLTYGAARSMGPGYFPTWLSALILGLGVITLLRSLVLEGPALEKFQIRPVFFVCLAVLLFGYLIEYIGLALSLIIMTFVAGLSRKETNYKEVAVLAVCMSVTAVVVFVYILGQAMPAWWGR